MSDLLNSASLVMIPSGYKEDVVYSQIPTDGSGDLSFTRASNGTRVNSAGLVEVCPWNYFENSNLFTSWVNSGASVTITSGQTDPNGGTNAFLYARTLAYDYLLSYVSVDKYTVYCTVKKATSNFFRIAGTGGGDAVFNVNTGVVASSSGSVTATIESLGNGWYKCIAYFDQNNGGFYLQNFPVANGDNGSGSVYIYQAQCNIGSTAKPYFPTTDRLNVPRLTYQNGGGGCPSLLLEKQSTNELSYSEQFDNAGWTKADVTVTANAITSPDGTQNADKIVENTANSAHGIYQSATITSGASWTWSGFFKAGGRTRFRLYAQSALTPYVEFNLSNGTIISTIGSVTGSIESMGNDWYRCIATTTTTGTNGYFNIAIADASGNVSYTGDGTSGIYVWGAQVEASSYATSYISTTSSSATRVADNCSKTGASSLIGQTEGTIFWEGNFSRGAGTKKLYSLNDGSSSNLVDVYTTADNDIQARVRANASGYGIINTTVANSRFKLAYAYKNNDFVLYINGSQIGAVTSGSFSFSSPLTIIQVGDGEAGGDELDGVVGEFVVFKTRISNTDLAQLTA